MTNGVAGVVLAGGHATRMGGGDKSLHLLDDRPILAHVIERLRPQVGEIVLNANGDPARFSTSGLEVIADPTLELGPDLGPLGGILAGMIWASTHPARYSHIVTVAADTPFFPDTLAGGLLAALADGGRDSVVLAASGRQVHPTFGLWPVALKDDLQAFLASNGAASVRRFASQNRPPLVVDFTIPDRIDPFFNVNTPEDLAQARDFMRSLKG